MRRTRPSSEGTTTSTMSFGVSGPDMRRVLSLALLSVRSSTQRGQQPIWISTRSPMEVSRSKMVSAGVNPEYHDRGNALEALAVVWAPVSALARDGRAPGAFGLRRRGAICWAAARHQRHGYLGRRERVRF